MHKKYEYAGWQILLNSTRRGWVCYVCQDGSDLEPLQICDAFKSEAAALAAAQQFALQFPIHLQISSLLDSWLEQQKITMPEYQQASELITQLALARLGSGGDRTQP